MAVVQHGQPQAFYRGNISNNIRDVKVRTLNDNRIRTSPSYPSSTRIDRNNGRSREIVSSNKSPPNTSSYRDMKRKSRVAKYKAYSAESKLKCSLKKGFRSLKIRCMNIVYNL